MSKSSFNTKARNTSIDFFKFIFSILIVALHTSPLSEYNAVVSYLTSQTVSRLGVPFFSAVAGYYYFKSCPSIQKTFFTLIKYAKLALFWTSIMLIYDIFSYEYAIKELIMHTFNVIIFGWHHLWYLQAICYVLMLMIMCLIVSETSIKLIYYLSFIPLMFGILIYNYGAVFCNIPILNQIYSTGNNIPLNLLTIILPFFMMGYNLSKRKDNKHITVAIPLLCTAGLILEILFTTIFSLHNNVMLCFLTYPSIYCIMLFCLSRPNLVPDGIAFALAKSSSAIYYMHYMVMIILTSSGFHPTACFLISTLLPFSVGIVYSFFVRNAH